MLKAGFYCALGTPLDKQGGFLAKSYAAQIDDQINNGASGLLAMGSMGMLGCVRSDQYESVARTAFETAGGRAAVMVGAADNSIARVRERIDQIKKYDVALVLTAPYYFSYSRACAMRYFEEAAQYWGKDVYLYDHPWTARYKCTFGDVTELMGKLPNLKGIKTGDLVLLKQLSEAPGRREDFTCIFSNFDLFTVARRAGYAHYLDGIYACFPKTAGRAEAAYRAGDYEGGQKYTDMIAAARDEMIAINLWPAFTCAMNLLGYEGDFGPDYDVVIDDEGRARVKAMMERLEEI